MIALMVGLGALVGAPLRYLTDRLVQRQHTSAFPWGTVSVNVVASLILGVVTGLGARVHPDLLALIGPGFCGTLSTYSTFSWEAVDLIERRERFLAGAYVLVSLAAGLGAASLGYAVGISW